MKVNTSLFDTAICLQLGHQKAQFNFGRALFKGDNIDKDLMRAKDFFEMAVAHDGGHERAPALIAEIDDILKKSAAAAKLSSGTDAKTDDAKEQATSHLSANNQPDRLMPAQSATAGAVITQAASDHSALPSAN